ncbi:MAG: hypothetical protein ACKOCT_10755 [Alphaproteobacteria bacterium]
MSAKRRREKGGPRSDADASGTAPAGHHEPRGSRAAAGAILALAFSAITLWWLWPLPSLWSDHSVNTLWWKTPDQPEAMRAIGAADVYLIVWELAWGTHALLSRPWSAFFDANIFHPSKLSLAYSEHLLGLAPLFAPLYVATGNPLLATNLLIFLTYPLCALAAYALARRWVGPPAAFVAGIVYAFYPLRYGTPPHVYMLASQWLPLIVLFALRWLDRARPLDAVLLAVAIALQGLSSFYFAYIVATLLGIALTLLLWQRRRALDGVRVAGLAAAVATGFVPVALMARPYLRLRELGVIPTYDPADLPSMPGLKPANARYLVAEFLASTGPSLIAWLLVIAAIAWAWRDRTRTDARSRRQAIALGLLLLGASILLALGPVVDVGGREIPSPVLLLFRWVPGFASMRGLGRFLFLAQLGVALLAAIGFQAISDRLPRTGAWAAAIGVAALSLALSAANRPEVDLAKEPSPADLPGVIRWLAENGRGRPLLEVPGATYPGEGRRMYLSTWHWLPILGGYSAYPPRIAQHLGWIAWNLPAEPNLQGLVNNVDVGWLLVHLGEMKPEQRARWEGALPEGLVLAGRFDDDLLFEVTRRPDDDKRARLLSTTETPNGVRLAPVGPRCPGAIRFLDERNDFPHRADQHWVAIEAVNRGRTPWPAFGFYPAHLVKGEARVLRDGRPVKPPIDLWFEADVRPGGPPSHAGNFVDTDGLPTGSYEIEVRLVQPADGPLSACGVKPVRMPIEVP